MKNTVGQFISSASLVDTPFTIVMQGNSDRWMVGRRTREDEALYR